MKRDRKEKFSIRKFSFGAASCLIGATIAMTSLSSKEVQAMSTTVVGDNGGTSVIYANWDDNPLKTNTNSKVSVNDEIVIKVDTSGYTKTRPIVTVTYYFNKNFMQNADGSITPTGTNNNIVRRGEVSWLGHRPDYWFTVPKGFSEPTSLVLTNARGSKQYNNWAAWRNSNSRGVASRYQSEADAKAMNNGSPDNWSRYNDHTQEGPIWEHNGSLNWYLNTRAGYGWDDGSDKAAYERLRNNTRSIYSDWENTAAAGAEIQVTYEVKDPVNTQYIELGAGVHINAGGIDHIKIETIALPDVDDTPENQKYEPNKLPARQGVKDVTSLTSEEKAALKAALKEKNPLLENRLKGGLENGISIANDGTATFTYTDNTTDTIPGKDLVYKEFKLKLNPDILINGIPYKVEQVAVENYEAISDEDRKRADAKLGELNGFTPDYTKNNYPIGLFNRSTVRNNTDYKLKNQDFAKWENDKLRIGGAEYFGRGSGYNELIPKDVLFAQIPKADNNAKQKGKDLINGLKNLTDAEKDEYKKKIDQLPANSSEDKINEIVNEALKKDAENKALKEAKEEAKKVVAALPNLTNEEKDAAKREIDNAATTDAVTTAKNNAIAKDLEKEKDKAKKRIDQIKDNLANPDDYKNQITAAKTKDEIAAIVRRAEDEAAKKQVEKNKTEADKVRDEAKRKIDAIPGLTEAEKKHFKDLIDGANTKGQIDKIVEAAKQYADSKAKREAVKKEIENLPHLNKAQKADFIESINATDDIPTISDISTKAHNLDARMGRLQDLVKYAKGNEVTDKYNKSDPAKKQVFDEAKKAAEKIADKENATDNAGVDLVQKLYKDLEDAIKKLGIDPVVLKTNKDALKAEVALNDNDAIKKGNPYKLATSDEKREAYDRAFEKAKDVLNREQATQDEINQAVRDLQNARYALDGKVADFTLKTTGVAEISVKPQEGTTLISDADKNLVKSKVRVTQSGTEGNVLDTDEVFYGNITSKDGKFYVPVTVGRDKVYHIVDVEVKEFTLAVKDTTKPAEISKTPVAGESLTAEDQAKVKEKVTANNEALKDTDKVTYGPIKEKDGKKVVPVTVTRDGVAKTIDVEVTKKVEEFTLAVKDATKPAEISKTPVAGESLTEADQAKVKEKVTANGEALKPTDTVTYGPIEDKNGKKVVPVTVTRDGVAKTVDVEVTKKAEDFTLAVKDATKPAEISKIPVAGESLTAEDQAKVKEKVTANGEALKPTDKVTYGPIKEKDGKKVVPVTVTRDGVAKTIDVEVTKKAEEFTLAVKDATKPAEISKTPVAGESLTEADQAKVKEKVTANGEALKPTDTVTYGPIEDKNGKKVVPVTVTRDGVAKTVEVLVVKKEDSTDSSGSQGNQDGQGGSGSQGNQDGQGGQGGSGSQGNQNGQGGQGGSGSQGNQNGQGGNADSNTEGPTSPGISADQSDLDKAKDKAKSDLTEAANKEKAEIEADKNLTEQQKADKKAEVDKVKKEQEANIDKAQTTDEVEKATEEGKKVIDAVHQTELDKAKEKAKADLTEAANKEKAEIEADKNLTEQQKADKKAEVDKVKKEQEANIDKAQTTDEVEKATEEGKKVIDAVHQTELDKAKEKAKADLTEAAAKEKAEIDADKNLTDQQKTDKKTEVDNAKKAAEANIDKATTPEEVAKATEDGKKAIDAVHQITPDQAKADLTDAANTEKGEIGGDATLTDKEKGDLKAKVDEVKKAAEDKINNAKTPEEIAKAAEEGKKAIADVYNPQTGKGKSTSIFKPELDLQTALVSGKATVEKGKDLTDEEILKQLALADGVTAKITSKPTTTETGTKEAEVEVTLADGTKVTVKVPVEVVASLDIADKDNDLAKAKEDAKKQVEDAAKAKIDEINKAKDLTEDQKQKAEEAINKAKEEANKAIDEASSAGTAKQIADEAKENIEKYNPKADTEVKKPDVTNLDEEKAKAKAEILEEAQKRINEIKNNKDVSDEEKQKAIDAINKAKDKAIEDINKGQSKDEIDAAKDNGIKKINEVQPEGSIASQFEPKVPENKVEVKNSTKLSDEEREKVRQNIEGVNTFPDGTTVDVKADGTAVITYKDGSSDTISKDKLVAPAKKDEGTIASRTEPVIPGKTQVGNTTKLTPEEQAAVKKAVEDANNFPAGTTVEVRPDGTVVITYPDKSVDTITGDKLVEKGSKQETPKVKTEAEKNPAQVPGSFVPVENTHSLTPAEQSEVAAKVKQANPTATVTVSKDGTATLTYSDGSVNTIPGTSLVVAKDTEKEAATQAAQNPAQVPGTTEVGNAHSLTPAEQSAVAAKVKQVNPTATDVKVSKDGTATLTYGDGSVNTIPGTSLVVQKEEVPAQDQPTIAEKTKVIIPVNPTKVAETTRLTDIEKEAVKKAVVEANGFGSDVNVEVAGDGTATIIFSDGSAITIPGSQLVAQDPKAQDSNKTDAEKTTVKAPAQRVEVKDITHLTDEEKEKVKAAILQVNGSTLDGVTIEVAGDGTAIITFPDGSVATILGKDTVQQSAKIEPAIEEKPEYTPESTPGQDNGGNTGRLDDNANSGNGSDAGAANSGDNNVSKEDAKGALAHTGLDNASGLGLSGLGLAMLGGVLAARRRKEK